MKKLFVFFMSLMFIMYLVGCNKSQKVNVDFIIDGESHLVKMNKGTSINKEIMPLSNKDDVVELYYDENMANEYHNELLNDDINIYVKTVLNGEIALNIKTSYISNFCQKETGLDEIIIQKYYGCYRGSYAVLMDELNKGDTGVIRDVVIADLIFRYPFGNREIMVWKEGKFFTLPEAYENKLLQRDDLIKIHQIFRHSNI